MAAKEFRACSAGILTQNQQIQEKHSDLPSFSEKQEIIFLYESCPPYTKRNILIIRTEENSTQTDLVKIIVIFL